MACNNENRYLATRFLDTSQRRTCRRDKKAKEQMKGGGFASKQCKRLRYGMPFQEPAIHRGGGKPWGEREGGSRPGTNMTSVSPTLLPMYLGAREVEKGEINSEDRIKLSPRHLGRGRRLLYC